MTADHKPTPLDGNSSVRCTVLAAVYFSVGNLVTDNRQAKELMVRSISDSYEIPSGMGEALFVSGVSLPANWLA